LTISLLKLGSGTAAKVIATAAWIRTNHLKREMTARHAADHAAFISAQRHANLLRSMDPNYRPDYTGPAGFGLY
jgi:hypothetical protein